MAFDPYPKWLGIPANEQPADHYRLLAIARFESDPDVIEGAADRQMGHVRTFQSGPHSAESQKILNELAAAKLCLLNPEKKATYDAELRRKLDAAERPQPAVPIARPLPAAHVPVAATLAAATPVVILADDAIRPSATHKRRAGRGHVAWAWAALAAAAIPVFVVIGYLVYTKPRAEPAGNVAAASRPKEPPASEKKDRSPATSTKQPDKMPDPTTQAESAPPLTGQRETASENVVSPSNAAASHAVDSGATKRFACDLPTPGRGRWSLEGEELVQSSLDPDATIVFGSPNWANFDFSFDVKRTSGDGPFGAHIRYQNLSNFWGTGFGIGRNHGVDSIDNGKVTHLASTTAGAIKTGQWHHVLVSVRGHGGRCALDGEPIMNFEYERPTCGRVGFTTFSPCRFRNIVVKDPGGKILLEGLPDLDGKIDNVVPAHAPPAPAVGLPTNGGKAPLSSAIGIAKASDAKLTATEAFSLKQHTAGVTRVAFHRTLPLLASAGRDGQVLLWNLETRAVQMVMHKFRVECWAIKFSPDGQLLAYANRNGLGSVLSFKNLAGVQVGQPIKGFSNREGGVASLAYSPDGRLLAAGQDDGSIRLWDTVQFKEVPPVSFGTGHAIWGLAFGPVTADRKRKRTEYLLAAACQDGTVKTLTANHALAKKEPQWSFQPTDVQFPKAGAACGMRFSPKGDLLGCSRSGGSVDLYHPRTGAPVRELARGGGIAGWIAFHPQRPWCVTAHVEAQVARIWNTETSQLLCELRGHTGAVWSAEFSPDGRQVATASDDFSIKLWDLTGAEVPTAGPRAKKPKPVALVVGE